MATDVPHRYATRSLPKALGSRLYGSIIRTFGINLGHLARGGGRSQRHSLIISRVSHVLMGRQEGLGNLNSAFDSPPTLLANEATSRRRIFTRQGTSNAPAQATIPAHRLYQRSSITTHRDRAGQRAGRRAGRRVAAGPAIDTINVARIRGAGGLRSCPPKL